MCTANAIGTEHGEAVAQACRLLEGNAALPLETLARGAGMSVSHFHRTFKALTGVTPKAYALAVRARRLRGELTANDSVTAAMMKAGFSSSSRFHASAKTLGMTPTAYRAGGKGEVIRFAVGQCSLGSVLVASSGKGVCAVTLGDDPQELLDDLQRRFRNARLLGADAGYERTVAAVAGLVENPGASTDLPLDIRGTAFQRRVWEALRKIPAGKTASYADIARAIGRPTAMRAVAQACGANNISVLIPCHRVVRTDGALSGYRWGIERKKELLRREGSAR